MPRAKTIFASKKRKSAMARVVLKSGQGLVKVNGIPLEYAFPQIQRSRILEALSFAEERWKKIDFIADIEGGGTASQADALRMAIAEGLVKWTRSKKLKALYAEKYGKTIFWDPRQREAKKFGGPGARRRKQKSYR